MSLKSCRIARDHILRIIVASKKLQTKLNYETLIRKDPRTVISHLDLDPTLNHHICCSACFKIYTIRNAPQTCTYQPASDAEECGEELFYSKTTFGGVRDNGETKHQPSSRGLRSISTEIPRSIHVTQTLVSWITWFLERSDIESEIQEWSTILSNSESSAIYDVQQAPAWQSLEWNDTKTQSLAPPLHPVFSLFIDWFNPWGNKIAGKKASIGLEALHCLNLPIQSRWKLANTCIAGIFPGPHEPSNITISHVHPFIDEILALEDGITVRTYQYPQGRVVQVKLLPLIADIVAAHNFAGFASHSHTRFCSLCHVIRKDAKNLEIAQLRTKEDTLSTAWSWKNAGSSKVQDKVTKASGIRWSELNRIPYRDPVMHVVLGVMHNWFEGVLQHHFRKRWGFASEDQPKKKKKKKTADPTR